jgi:hypothetical protein
MSYGFQVPLPALNTLLGLHNDAGNRTVARSTFDEHVSNITLFQSMKSGLGVQENSTREFKAQD